ncbi:MAG: YHS domain protein [Chitinophagaceae bacterium]|nr:YHS domain protein [Chitinophagaceae bacterium]
MKGIVLIGLLVISSSFYVSAQDVATNRKQGFNLDNGIAIQGYDAVAYLLQNKAVKGSKTFAVNYQGIIYYFSSEVNKAEFIKSPAKFEPQYGGWCAYAMGENGEKVSVDPKTFKIVAGKLYLFYNRYFNNTLTDWNKDETNLKRKADSNWQRLFK